MFAAAPVRPGPSLSSAPPAKPGRKSSTRFALALTLAGPLLLGATAPLRADAPVKGAAPPACAPEPPPSSGRTSATLKLDGELTPEHLAQIKALGGDVYRSLPFIQSVAVSVPACNLARLAGLPFVSRLTPNTRPAAPATDSEHPRRRPSEIPPP